MRLKIGETLKRLRKERDITQEQFAEFLNVSCQSVSRWENNTCYPDIELIPVIAEFFAISTDVLLGIDEVAQKEAVKNYLSEYQKALSHGDIDRCICIARTGATEFPNNYKILNKLMLALFLSGSDDANIPNWKDNIQKYDNEIISIGERIIKYCSDINISLEATARLAYQHYEMGRKEEGRRIYDTLPSMLLSKEMSILWWKLDEDEKLPATREYIENGYKALRDGIWKLAKLLSPQEALAVFAKLDLLQELMHDGKCETGTWMNVSGHVKQAEIYMQLGDQPSAFLHLRAAEEAAIAFDNRPEENHITSLLLGEQIQRRVDYDTSDDRLLRIILRDTWLAASSFDSIRETEEFKSIIQALD